jgi:hypothetical protein
MQPIFLIAILVKVLILSDYQFVQSVDTPGDMHFSDPMGNVYVVQDNTLKKFSSTNEEAGHYTNTFLGNIHSVDVSDPLRILLYYKDHNQIVWVDNFLSEIRSPVWLDALGIDQIELVCSSNQGGFWVFNSLNNQLQYYDVNLQLVHESPTLNILTGPDITPTSLLEKSRSLYLNIPGIGILVFDRFGNYSKTLALEASSEFQVTDNYVYFMKEGELFSYDLRTADIALLDLPEMPISESSHGNNSKDSETLKAELQPGRLFVFTRKGYAVFKTKP